MIKNDLSMDLYDYYEVLYDPMVREEANRRMLGPRGSRLSHEDSSLAIEELTDDAEDLELGFRTTYQPSRYEAGWLLSSLRSFYEEGILSDVLALAKGGKEASVYCCEAHPATGLGLLAAKVYRPRMFRSLRNDRVYRQGREILTPDGRPAGKQAGTFARAIRNKTAFGNQIRHTSWLMHEFTALESLFAAGASVPRPIAASQNAILMSYHGDEMMAAPTLNTVALDRDEAGSLLDRVLHDVDLMLQQDLIHGDLSSYNMLYWEGEITIIDLPQVVNVRANEHARPILERDIQRTCAYFIQQGVPCEPAAIIDGLWERHVEGIDPMDRVADWSRVTMEEEEDLYDYEADGLDPAYPLTHTHDWEER